MYFVFLYHELTKLLPQIRFMHETFASCAESHYINEKFTQENLMGYDETLSECQDQNQPKFSATRKNLFSLKLLVYRANEFVLAN